VELAGALKKRFRSFGFIGVFKEQTKSQVRLRIIRVEF
jgi:hypothetical protein